MFLQSPHGNNSSLALLAKLNNRVGQKKLSFEKSSTVKPGLLHSQVSKPFYAIKQIMCLCESVKLN